MIEVLEVGMKEMRDNTNLTYSYWYVTGLCNYECDYCDIFHDESRLHWLDDIYQYEVVINLRVHANNRPY